MTKNKSDTTASRSYLLSGPIACVKTLKVSFQHFISFATCTSGVDLFRLQAALIL